MGRMFSSGFEKEIYHDNHKEFEKKVHSQYAKYLNEIPFFTDYFHIVKSLTTTDTGLLNVDKLYGENSPIRYNLIKDFPLYGLEQILTDINDDDDIGLQTEYNGEAIILPNTITPMPDDHFYITALGKKHLFRVTEIHYDTILDRNYYKINFSIKTVDNTYFAEYFLKNVSETFVCIYDNYGTQDSFIIKESDYNQMEKLNILAEKMKKKYMMFFYNERYNALMVKNPHGSNLLYDAYVNYFCNENNIFSQNPRELWNYKFYIEKRPEFEVKYNFSSIFALVKNKDLNIEVNNYYDEIPTFSDSIFKYYGDYDTRDINIINRPFNAFGRPVFKMLPDSLINSIKTGSNVETTKDLHNIIVAYMNDNPITFPEDIKIRPDYEHYILVPLFLYILYKNKGGN